MEDLERRATDTYDLKPEIWLRYVDDTFVVWPHGEESLNGFLRHLNNIEESIKFTREIESENNVPFLDVLVHKREQQEQQYLSQAMQDSIYTTTPTIHTMSKWESPNALMV